jgi:hypothetical protein
LASTLGVSLPTITSPLRVHPTNSHYFTNDTGKAIILTGSHTWGLLQEWGMTLPAPAEDIPTFVNFLTEHGHNCTILWRIDVTAPSPGRWLFNRQAWTRPGPGTANDGLPKFDLTTFDQSFFDRLRDVCEQLYTANIYAIVGIVDGNDVFSGRAPNDTFALTGSNNINGVDDGYPGSGSSWAVSQTMRSPNRLSDIWEALCRKYCDTLHDLPNVLFQVGEEADPASSWWSEDLMATIREYEEAQGYLRHPVGRAVHIDHDDAELFASSADWVAPYNFPITTDNHGKVILADTDHLSGANAPGMGSPSGDRSYVWKAMCHGSQLLMMDPYLYYITGEGNTNPCPNPTNGVCGRPLDAWDADRDQLGYALIYASKCRDLASMTPQPSKASTGYALVNAAPEGAEFLVYSPDGGTFSVDLSGVARPLTVEWFNPRLGQAIPGTAVVPGGTVPTRFTPPFPGDALLYLSDAQP